MNEYRQALNEFPAAPFSFIFFAMEIHLLKRIQK